MKKITALLISIFSTSFALAQNNTVVIKGSTNINTFKCKNSSFGNYNFKTSEPNLFQLAVKDFDCGNKIMTTDFKKTLKAEQFPKMTVKFKNITKINATHYNAIIEVKLMDKTKSYTTEFVANGDNITGHETVRFSDFDIVPPKKMGGLVVVNNNLYLTLTLNNS